MKINKKIIEELTGYLEEFNLAEIEYAEGTTKVKVSRSTNTSGLITVDSKSKQSSIKKNQDMSSKITSPIVGTAYLAPEPGAKPFIEIGQKVKIGDILFIIEAMKTMNQIPSALEGTVKEILVSNESPVEFDTPLIIVE